jgi:L-fuconolactonase
MKVIDSHIHFWDPAQLDYSWLSGVLDRSFVPGDVAAGATSIGGMVFVQADCEPHQALAEVQWVSQMDAPIAGIVAFAAVENGTDIAAHLHSLQAFDRVRGIRRNVQNAPDEFFVDPKVHAGLSLVSAAGLSFDLCLRWQQLGLAGELLRGNADLRVVLDHLGKPPIAAGWNSEERHEWQNSLRALAAREGTAVKLSGLAPETTGLQDLAVAARPFLDFALQLFGADRCMFGSDWPVSTSVPISRHYDEWADIVFAGLSPVEQEQVATGTATTFYRL